MRPQDARAIGFWFSPQEVSLPRPQRLVDPGWARDERAAVASYLRAGAVVAQYRGMSFCRFRCGIDSGDMGSTDLGDGEWIWPEGLVHYVEAHSVRLPDQFIARALALRTPDAPPSAPDPDTQWWQRWSSARGACVPFDRGWTEIGFQDESSIGKQLSAAGGRDFTLLARRDDGDAVLCSDFRVLSVLTGEVLASASDDDEASFDRAAGVPAMAVPTETDLRAWAAEMIARPPRFREVETVVAWVPDGLAGVVEHALAPGRFILLGAEPGTGGAWQRSARRRSGSEDGWPRSACTNMATPGGAARRRDLRRDRDEPRHRRAVGAAGPGPQCRRRALAAVMAWPRAA